MNEKENEKRMEENVFYVLTYIMKEYVTRIVENATTLQKMVSLFLFFRQLENHET